MRIAIVAESFLPQMNGVTGSVLRILDHLDLRGHQVVVIAAGHGAPAEVDGIPVLHVPSVGLPRYPQVRVCLTSHRRISEMLAAFAPDVIHLASPIQLGYKAIKAAHQLDVPTVAVFQTDVAGFAVRYGFPGWADRIWARLIDVHQAATRTLVPSEHTMAMLADHDIARLHKWGRGVDLDRFSPERRDQGLHDSWADGRQTVVGFLGRLAPEKQVEDLVTLARVTGVRTVIIGDGPLRAKLEELLPAAVFTGHLDGDELPRALASFDVMVHPGESETFCQAVQESLASGVPVVAPAIGGPAELIDSSRTGWLYGPGDLDGMRSSVADLVGDAAKRRAFGRAARQSVQARSWTAIGDQLIGHYEAAISEHASVVSSRPGRRHR